MVPEVILEKLIIGGIKVQMVEEIPGEGLKATIETLDPQNVMTQDSTLDQEEGLITIAEVVSAVEAEVVTPLLEVILEMEVVEVDMVEVRAVDTEEVKKDL
jgi:hypothetical protein